MKTKPYNVFERMYVNFKSSDLFKLVERWYPLEQHDVQINFRNDILNKDIRYVTAAAGRRSGKTEIAKRGIAEILIENPNTKAIIAAPTFTQVKRIYLEDMLSLLKVVGIKKFKETSLEIMLNNDSKLFLMSLDDASRLEGISFDILLIDEADTIKESFWDNNILPAVNTMVQGKMISRLIVIGVPEGKRSLYRFNQADNFKSYHWLSSLILPEKDIQEAKDNMDEVSFKREYEASFDLPQGTVYKNFTKDNITKIELNNNLPLVWTLDQNYDPQSSAILQEYEDKDVVVDEIIIKGADVFDVIKEFKTRYENHQHKTLYLYGDASGRQGEKHNLSSFYTTIKNSLSQDGWTIHDKVLKSNPKIQESQGALRSAISTVSGERRLLVNKNCKMVIKSLEETRLKDGSAYIEIEDDWQHVGTALRYYYYAKNKFDAIDRSIKSVFDSVTIATRL